MAVQNVADCRHLVLAHTLSIMTALSEEDLLTRTLAAACSVTDAPVALAIAPDGSCTVHGSDSLLAGIDPAAISAVTSGLSTTGAAALGGTTTGGMALDATTLGLDTVGGSSGAPAVPRQQPGSVAQALSAHGLPSVVTALFGDTTIALASRDGLGAEASSLLALVVAHAQAARDRLRELDLLARQAESDPLTGLRHHRKFEERLAASSPGRTAIIALDVDQFKKINDEYGHQAGDHALVTLVEALTQALRGDDQLYRIGGDEFAVIVDVNGIGEAFAIARRLLDAARIAGRTISVGAALHLPGETGRETLLRADKALYEAKRSGRDTARVAA